MKNFLRPLITLFKYAKWGVLSSILLSVLIGLTAPFFVYANERLFDGVIAYVGGNVSVSVLISLILFYFVCLILPRIFNIFLTISQNNIHRHLYKKFDEDFIKKQMDIKYECLENKEISEMLYKMSDPKEMIGYAFKSLILTISSVVGYVGVAIYFAKLNWIFSVLFCIVGVIGIVVQGHNKTREIALQWGTSEITKQKYNLLDIFQNEEKQRDLRTFIGNDYLETKTKDACDQLANMTISCQRKNLLESCLSFISMWGVSIFVIISTFVGLLNATLSIGVFAAVVSAVWSIQSKITVIGNQFSQFAFLEKETRYYYEFMALPSRNIGTKDLPKDIEIKFENVCFTYPNTEKQILSNLNLTFKLNKNIAIVGENGSGKSTIIKLLARLYEPTCGKITVGGVLLQDLTDEAISELFGFVFQEIRHYSLSLRENVAIGDDKKEQDDNAIKTALSNAGGLDLISQCGDNLDTMIGYRNKEGQQFSGGQYQRLQISRAFLSEHKFIVLDEPVASLDAFAESQMYETFLRLFKDKGVIVISHRLASAKLADEIFMLKDGKLLTTGTHKTLMKKCALYSEMFTTQAKQYAIEKKNSAKKGVKNDKE